MLDTILISKSNNFVNFLLICKVFNLLLTEHPWLDHRLKGSNCIGIQPLVLPGAAIQLSSLAGPSSSNLQLRGRERTVGGSSGQGGGYKRFTEKMCLLS